MLRKNSGPAIPSPTIAAHSRTPAIMDHTTAPTRARPPLAPAADVPPPISPMLPSLPDRTQALHVDTATSRNARYTQQDDVIDASRSAQTLLGRHPRSVEAWLRDTNA